MILCALSLGLALVGGTSSAASNRLENFSIQQCHGAVCATARGDMAFVNLNGRVMYGGRVTLTIRTHGRDDVHRCDSFSADLSTGRYVCDNRAALGPSLALDAQMNLTTFE